MASANDTINATTAAKQAAIIDTGIAAERARQTSQPTTAAKKKALANASSELDKRLLFGTLHTENERGGTSPRQHGVFGLHPLATPKYALNKGQRDAEFKESLARMYVSLADAGNAVREAYLHSLPPDARTQALAKVLTSNSKTGFIDFFLQQVQEQFSETAQVDKVLGDNYVAFYFGQEPPMFQFSGTLLNSQQDDQRTGFALAFQHLLRGTQLARRGALLRIRYDSVIVSGSIHAMSQVVNAENELAVPFNFSLLVKEYVILTNPNYEKLSTAQYVQLNSQFTTDAHLISGVGAAQDIRVRTTIYNSALENASTTPKTLEDTPKDAAAASVFMNDAMAAFLGEPQDTINPGTDSAPPPPHEAYDPAHERQAGAGIGIV